MKIKIGKASDNDFVIEDPQVSRYHALLVVDETPGEWLLEDLNSTNGTYVNDGQIIKKRVSVRDKVTFGTDYTLQIGDILKGVNDYSDDFARLKNVYEAYIKEKIRIQSSNQFKTRLFLSLPFAFLGFFGIVYSFVSQAKPIFFILSLILSVCAPTFGIYLGARQAAKIPAQLQNLAGRFKIDYVCPKCGVFLGEIPWESLSNKKQCPVSSCRAKWVRT
jgi:hypothetical protein